MEVDIENHNLPNLVLKMCYTNVVNIVEVLV